MKVLAQIKVLDQAAKLTRIFRHNNFGFIVADKQTVNWIAESAYPLSSGELVQLFLDEQKLIGVGFGKTTKYIMLDIDWLSKYHPTHDIDQFRAILHALETIGLTRHLVIRSSDSGGIHVYFPLPEELPTFQLAASVRVTLTDAGFEIKNGHLETFPNTKSFARTETGEFSHYNRHRIPFQPHSGSWLLEDDGLNPQPIFNTTEAQLAAFFHQWDIAAAGQDLELLKQKLPQLYLKFLERKNRFKYQSSEEKTEKAKKWETALDLSIKIGWTGCGQTYHLLPKFLAKAVVFLKLTGSALYEWMYQAIINAVGYQQYCRHQHEIEKMIRSWIKTNERTGYYSPYRSEPDRNQPYPFGNRKLKAKIVRKPHTANIKRSDEAAIRIKVAYENLKDRFTAETTITEMRDQLRAEIQEKYGVGIGTNTLSRHKNIWHPEHNLGDNTSPTEKNEQSPGTLTDKDLSECIDSPEIDIKPTQPHAQSQEYYSQIPMICGGDSNLVSPDLTTDLPQTSFIQPHSLGSELVLEVEQDLTNYTKHYNLPPDEVVTQKPGKFEVLGGALSKIATLAALVVNMMAGVELVGGRVTFAPAIASPFLRNAARTENPEPTIAAEIGSEPVTLGVMTEIVPPASVINPIEAGEVPLRPCDGAVCEQFSPTPTTAATAEHPSESIAMLVEQLERQPTKGEPMDSPPEPTPMATIRRYQPQQQTQGDICPECKIVTPTVELEQWSMCRFCAQKILWRRLV